MYTQFKANEITIDDLFNEESKTIRKELISDYGSKNIMKLIFLLTEKFKFYDKEKRKEIKVEPLKRNQLRKFYDSFLRIYDARIEEEEQKKVLLLMLKANGEYSANRLNIRRFEIFLSNRINIVLKKEGKEFEKYMDALKLHFEALVGYFPKNKIL